jgi:hypothetical protein
MHVIKTAELIVENSAQTSFMFSLPLAFALTDGAKQALFSSLFDLVFFKAFFSDFLEVKSNQKLYLTWLNQGIINFGGAVTVAFIFANAKRAPN